MQSYFISVSSQFIGYYMYILLLLQAGQVWKSNERLRRTQEGEDGDGWISLSGVGDKQGGNGAGGTGISNVCGKAVMVISSKISDKIHISKINYTYL